MIKLVCCVCVMFVVVDATFHQQCELSCPDDPSHGNQQQGQKGDKGESTTMCNCSALNNELATTKEELSQTKQELSDLKHKPRDCYDVIYYNKTATSGVYTIFPPNYRPGGIEVWCDMETDGGGWIVFQNRKDGSVDFYRGWKDYLIGFGDLSHEFWLGLEYIHQLTKFGTYDLRVDMTDFEQNEAYAVYSSFVIGEGPGYQLKFGDYFGDAGDAMAYHLNQKFTTFDHDQDSRSTSYSDPNCAVRHVGAWWFNNCKHSNLNGEYLGGEITQKYHGLNWYEWKGDYYSVKSSSMKIRPQYGSYF